MARSFPGGSSATDKIQTNLASNTRLRTYSIWSYRVGDGGGGSGRMFNKGTTGTTEYLTNVSSTNSYDYSRFWTGGASWRAPRPSANAWHSIIVRYDSNSSSNVPDFFTDGVLQTLTPNSSPSGSPQDNAEPFVVGQRVSDNAREWDGMLAEFAVWDRLLSDAEIAALAQGVSPLLFAQSLVEYVPMVRDNTSYILAPPTITGTTVADHPRIYAPGSPQIVSLPLTTVVTPGPATLTLSTFAPSVVKRQVVTPPAASLALTKFAPQLQQKLTPTNRTLTLTRFAPVLQERITPATASLTLTRFAPVLSQTVTPQSAALAFTTFAPQVRELVTPLSRTLVLTTFAPALDGNVTVIPASANLTLTRFAPSVINPVVITPGSRALILQTFPPQLRTQLQPSPAMLITTTFPPRIREALTPAGAAVSLTTFSPHLQASITVTASTLTLITFAPTVSSGEFHARPEDILKIRRTENALQVARSSATLRVAPE